MSRLYRPTYRDKHGRLKHSRFWWRRWYQGGQYHSHRLEPKTANYRVALSLKAQKDAELARRRSQAVDVDLTIGQAIERYLASSQPHKTPRTFRTDRYRFEKIADRLGSFKLLQLSTQHIDEFLVTLQRTDHLSTATRNHYLKLLKAFGTWCMSMGYLIDNPAKSLKKAPVITPERPWIPLDQWSEFLHAAKTVSPYHFPMIATALLTGLRYGELINLEWTDIDWTNHLITVRVKDDWAPKSKRGRIVPLIPALRTILWPLKQPAGYCFLTPHGKRYITEPRPQVLARIFRAIGMKGRGLGFHTLRHSYATALVQRGMSIWGVKELLGHADVRTTDRIYAHAAKTYNPQVAQALNIALRESIEGKSENALPMKKPLLVDE